MAVTGQAPLFGIPLLSDWILVTGAQGARAPGSGVSNRLGLAKTGQVC